MSEQQSDILDRLRAANPVAVDEDRGRAAVAQLALERILEDPAAPTDPRDDKRRRPRARVRLGALPVLIGVILTIAVAGVVLTSVRDRHPSTPARPAVAARNGKVAFIAGNMRIFSGPTRSEHGVTWAFNALGVSNPDGSGRRNVGSYRCAMPTYACGVDSFAWSPDGTQIAYLAGHPAGPNAPTNVALYLVDANGQDPRELASCGNCSTALAPIGPSYSLYGPSPSWSPDGSTIALTRQTGQGQDIWLVNVKTGRLHRLTDCASGNACADESAEWSPGGEEIVFRRSVKGHVASIYTVRPDGTHITLIAAVAGAQAPQWSPDGRKITFQANDGIYTVNADGTRLRHITAAGSLAFDPSWSPDGTKLLYQVLTTNTDGDDISQLWTINPNGSENRRVYQALSPAGWSLAVWSPDGKQLAVSTNVKATARFVGVRGTLVMNADGTDVRRVGEPATQVAWQPIP
jgi:Tol biopolymer transport system component